MARWKGRRPDARTSAAAVASASGLVVSAAGAGLAGAGVWALREVRRGLERERIAGTDDMTPPGAPVTTGPAARSLAEVIRARTLETAGGRTYGETDLYVGADGRPTSDRAAALVDERTGEPVEHPAHALWLQSTTLQTALTQAYMGSRLAVLTIGIGTAFLAAGVGLAACGRRA